MQLTKDDLKKGYDPMKVGSGDIQHNVEYIDYSKFLQVVEFYDEHQMPWTLKKDKSEWFTEWRKYYDEHNLEDDDLLGAIYLKWLHDKCFKEGLK